ncbi:MAG: LysR family transcriptional regulator [Gammaproteobacteria bacterium]
MKITAIQLFVDVMRAGGFAAAAAESGRDPSSVSRAIAALERKLGVKLFERTTRRFEPTEAGRLYFEQVEPLLDELGQAAARARDLSTRPGGVLRVSTSVAFGCEVLAPLAGELRQHYPELELDVAMSDARIDLVAERIDVAIRLGPPPPDDLVRVRLMPTRHRVCAAPGWLARHGQPAAPAALGDHDCVRFPYAGFRERWRFRDRAGREMRVGVGGSVVMSSALAVKRCVLDGLGPGLLADWMIGGELAAGSLVDLFPDHDVTATGFDTAAWLLYPSRAYVPLKLRVFIDFLTERLGPA